MRKVDFNQSWSFQSDFQNEILNVDLPFDGMLLRPRQGKGRQGSKKGYFQNGSYVYEKHFRPAFEEGECHLYVEFEGVYKRASLFLNGVLLAKHEYGYTPFTVELTPYLHKGEENTLRVLCSTSDDSRWYSGGGITRPVYLYYGKKQHFPPLGVKITTESLSKQSATIRLSSQVSPTLETLYEIYDGQELIASGKGEEISLCVPSPKTWNEFHPYLYTLKATLRDKGEVYDSYETKFGIRSIQLIPGEGLFINGEKTLLYGACIHHDNGILGAVTHPCLERRKIRKLKEAGFNAVRISHHPAASSVLNACDELGMYVLNEAFDQFHQGKSEDDYSHYFDANQESDIRALVETSFNHPSVILYSCGNEIPDLARSEGIETLDLINREIKALDPTRPTLTAINGLMVVTEKEKANHPGKVPGEDINLIMTKVRSSFKDIHSSPATNEVLLEAEPHVDLLGYNYMPERYPIDLALHPRRLILGTETYPKEAAEVYRYMQTHNNVIGDFLWAGVDYLGEAGLGSIDYHKAPSSVWMYGEYPYLSADCGDLDLTLERLPASYLHQIAMGKRSDPYIVSYRPLTHLLHPHLALWAFDDVFHCFDYPSQEGKEIRADVYSASSSISLYLNGELIGKEKTKDNIATFLFPYQKGRLEAIDEEGHSSHLSSLEGDIFLTAEVEKDDFLFVDFYLKDKQGTIAFNFDETISLSLEGGVLLGFGNGNPKDEEPFSKRCHRTYHGHALAIIKPTAKTTTLLASSRGQTIRLSYQNNK